MSMFSRLPTRRFWWLRAGLIGAGLALVLVRVEPWNHLPRLLTGSVEPVLAQDQASQDISAERPSPPPAAQPDSRLQRVYAKVPPPRQQLIGLETAVVEPRRLETTIRAEGKVAYNEQHVTHFNLRLSGWVQDLSVDYTGQIVRQGEPLFSLYSQSLVATQEEFLLALRTRKRVNRSPLVETLTQSDALVQAARDRLRLWGLTNRQIDAIARRGRPRTYLTIMSPVSGYVVDKQVFEGMYVKPDLTLYTIADLSTVWILANVYEYEAPFVRVSQAASLTLASHPGKVFRGEVSYIYPYLNEEARTVLVRLAFRNPELQLKPGMYGTVRIQVHRGTRLAVPEQAVLETGNRSIVFVARGSGFFEPREVVLGPKVGDFYEVEQGLRNGERIVTSGTFLLDSESQLKSLGMSQQMGALGMGGIKMEQAEMGKMKMAMAGPDLKPGISPSEVTLDNFKLALNVPAREHPRLGMNRFQLHLTDQTGEPLTRANVRLTYTLADREMIPATIQMEPEKPGDYEANVNLGVGGTWDLTVQIEHPDYPPQEMTFSVTVARSGLLGG